MYLIETFHAFYAEVLSLEKQMAASQATAVEVRDALERLLERQMVEAEREHGQYGKEIYGRAKYARVATADELFLRPQSSAQEVWIKALLESAVFQGQFRGRDDAAESLEGYRRKLFHIIYGHDPQHHESAKILPRAYESTVDDKVSAELPYLKPWAWALVLVFILWIAIAHAIWRSAVTDLEPWVNELAAEPATAGGAS